MLAHANAKPGNVLTQIVMECCDKGTLHTAIEHELFSPNSRWGVRVALRALLRTAGEIAQGMLHIHEANVVHGGACCAALHCAVLCSVLWALFLRFFT